MNKGVEELKAFLPEIYRKKEESFFRNLCRRFIKDKNITPIKKKMDSPYLVIKMSIDDFKKSKITWIGNRPNWDLNWGHMFWCVECLFYWDENEVVCIFQNENESLNKTRLFGNGSGLITTHIAYRCPPSIHDW